MKITISLSILLILLVFSCDDSSTTETTNEIVWEATVEQAVDSAGGIVTEPGSGITLSIPDDALVVETIIQIGPAENVPIDESIHIPDMAFYFGPSGQEFDEEVEITFPYSADDIPTGIEEGDLQVHFYNIVDDSWVTVDSDVDLPANTITAWVNHFSIFTPGGDIPPMASELLSVDADVTSATLTWTENEDDDFENYAVYYAIHSGVTVEDILGFSENDDDEISATLQGLAPATTYYFTIVTYDEEGLFSISNELTATTGSFPGMGSMTDIDGNVYPTVVIEGREWMMTNLKVSRYRNGDPIEFVPDSLEWEESMSGACCIYNNDLENEAIFGRLYNWYAVADPRNIAPEGWHVPSDEEFRALADSLGGWQVAGGKLKATGTRQDGDGLWDEPNEGATNETGFSGLPGGTRTNQHGLYYNRYDTGFFWTTTEYEWFDNQSQLWQLWDYDAKFNDSNSSWTKGCSVRCVKDY